MGKKEIMGLGILFIKRFIALFIGALLLFSSAAQAGDFASEDVIGFSPDGRYFGFEEYGVEDGSGFPYSNIFIIDLETDTFVPQTPVRERLDDEKAALNDARAAARERAQALFSQYQLTLPATTVYARGLGDFANFEGGLTQEIVTKIYFPDFSDPTAPARDGFDLILRHIPAPSVASCPIDTIGFQLEKIDPDGKRRFVHRDEKIFKSRGCPLKYRISKVYVPAFEKGDFAAVLISVFQTGFEGLDQRFIVFPVLIR